MSNLVITTVEFQDIKNELIAYLSTRSEFTDYNFTGSGLNYLIDILSYIIHNLSFQLNMSANEVISIYSAQLTKNIYSHAKNLNYSPRRPVGAIAYIDIEIQDAEKPISGETIVIPKYTVFSSQGFLFYTQESFILNPANSYKLENIAIKQGTILTDTTVSDGLINQTITLESAKIDNNEFSITVNSIEWAKESDFTNIESDSQVYMIELTEDGYVKIIFGDGIVGEVPANTVDIVVTYAETEGLLGNNLSEFTITDILQDNLLATYDNSMIDITTVEQSLGGADIESNSSVQINAPKFNTSQNRIVRTSDWEAFLNRHEYVNLSGVWEGHSDLYEQVHGEVHMSVKPQTGLNLTANQKQELVEYLSEYHMDFIKPVFYDIDYFYTEFVILAQYYKKYQSQEASILAEINSNIDEFFADENEVNQFNHIFKMSALDSKLYNLERISNTTITPTYYTYFTTAPTGAYVFYLQNEIKMSSVVCNISETEGFSDDGSGNIIDVDANIIGTIDYVTGVIIIYPGYTITESEPISGYKLEFMTIDEDIYFKQNRLVINNTNTITLLGV